MHPKLQEFAKKEIIKGLQQCTPEQIIMFKKMYSHKDLDADINTIVNKMTYNKLNHALTQIENTIKENNSK